MIHYCCEYYKPTPVSRPEPSEHLGAKSSCGRLLQRSLFLSPFGDRVFWKGLGFGLSEPAVNFIKGTY